MDRPRPHDLLWLKDGESLRPEGAAVTPWPAWATPEWRLRAPVVVRRAPRTAGWLPVGLRGLTRSQRCAAQVPADRVIRIATPESIARDAVLRADLAGSPLACVRALAQLAPALDALGLDWGVTGGAGFALASGLPVLRDDSDLDLLVRAPSAEAGAALRTLAGLLPTAAARVDAQVETPFGAFALLEWRRTGGPVLLKTDGGPRLCDDAWRDPLDLPPTGGKEPT